MNSKCVCTVERAILGLVLSSCWGAGAFAQVRDAVAQAAIYTDFEQSLSPTLFEEMRAEAEAIMLPGGVRFQWRALSDFRSDQLAAEVVVVHFHARCDAEGLVMRGSDPGGPLGWTETSGGAVQPFIHVDCGRLRGFLQTALVGYRSEERYPLFARALGRVLAHELYHVLAATPKHTGGVSREGYGVRDLLAPAFRLRTDEIETLQTSKTVMGIRAAAASGGPAKDRADARPQASNAGQDCCR
jgi:hypothetical protein